MFKFNELNQIHLEITNNCQASCPMCNRNIDSGIDNPLIKINDWTLDDFKQIMTPEVLNQIKSFYFCSNFGDPMMNNDLIDMCRYSTDIAPTVMVTIHTNGSARSKAWWTKLASSLPTNHKVVFALDGLEDTHQLYRVGTNYETIIDNARAFILAGGIAEWVFIKFKHNEHQVEEARKRSIKLGFKSFVLKNSSRFILEPKVNVVNRNGQVTHFIEPASDVSMKFIDRKAINSYKEIISKSTIKCKVQHDKEIYIDAYKDVYPCCWIAGVPYSYLEPDRALEVRLKMLQQHKELMSKLGDTNALNKSIPQIIESLEYQSVWNDFWNTNKLITCVRNCGVNNFNYAQPKDQLVP